MPGSSLPRLLLAGTLLLGGCQTAGEFASAVDTALYQAVPTHPVTGRPMANLVSESQEISTARQGAARIVSSARAKGVALDPPGKRLDQVRRVFANLVAVAHRQHLPWEVHLIRDPTPNAFTFGGGVVFVFEGIFTDHPSGQGFVHPNDDELAAVLAHEIAHVTLMHLAERQTNQLFSDRHRKDPYYSASYTTADEAEADKLSVLYMALAGYDPAASARVWQEAHRKYGSNPGLYLYDHPLAADRIRLTSEAAAQVRPYYTKGRRNPDWTAALSDNPLFPHAAPLEPGGGSGFLKAVGAAAGVAAQHQQAKAEAKRREQAAQRLLDEQAARVRLVKTQLDQKGRPLIQIRIHNDSRYDVAELGFRVTYRQNKKKLAEDKSCVGQARIRAGDRKWLTCPYRPVPGADRYQVEVTSVRFR